MKKILYSAMAAMLALGAGSCSNEIVENEITPDSAMRTLTVRMVESEATRTTFTETGTGLDWEAGDQVAYFIDGGTCQIADIAVNGTFSVTLDAEPHTIAVVYPVGSYTEGAARNTAIEKVPTVQSQTAIDKFNGANLPLTGTASVASGTGNAEIDAIYAINDAAIFAFTITATAATYDTETLSSLALSADGATWTVALPTDNTVAELKGKTVYAVIPSGTYDDIKVSLHTSAASYRCATDLADKISGGTVVNGKRYKATLGIDAATVTRTAGLQVKLGDGNWQTWDGTQATLRAMDDDINNDVLASGNEVGVSTPYSIKVATGGTTPFTKANMTALVGAISALDPASLIALDMSAVKMAQGTDPDGSDQPLYDAFYNGGSVVSQLWSFVFPTDGTNITSLSYAFYWCSNLTSVSAIPSSVTNMDHTFLSCTNFNQPIIIPNGVTNMDHTFYGCTNFNQSITIPNGVTNMSYTFYYCTALASTVTINIASGKSITTSSSSGTSINIYEMFGDCHTGNINLKVTNGYCPNAASKLWYSSTIGNWTFNSVTAI